MTASSLSALYLPRTEQHTQINSETMGTVSLISLCQ